MWVISNEFQCNCQRTGQGFHASTINLSSVTFTCGPGSQSHSLVPSEESLRTNNLEDMYLKHRLRFSSALSVTRNAWENTKSAPLCVPAFILTKQTKQQQKINSSIFSLKSKSYKIRKTTKIWQ